METTDPDEFFNSVDGAPSETPAAAVAPEPTKTGNPVTAVETTSPKPSTVVADVVVQDEPDVIPDEVVIDTSPVGPDPIWTDGHYFGLTEVKVGDSDGHAALAVRWLGAGDGGVYTQGVHERLLQRIFEIHRGAYVDEKTARETIAERVPTLKGAAWAYVLPNIHPGDTGAAVVIARGLLQLPPGDADQEFFTRAGHDWIEGPEEWDELINWTRNQPATETA